MILTGLKETSIPQTFATEYETTVGPQILAEEAVSTYRAVITATADYLRMIKKKNAKTSLVFADSAANFIMAAVVEYNKNSEEGQDNWNFYFTFDEEDIKDAANKHDTNEAQFHAVVTNRLFEHGLRVNESVYISPLISMTASSLSTFLEQNATPGEEVTLEEEGYFVASVTVEDDKPVKALLPDGAMKTLIKDDAATEKAA